MPAKKITDLFVPELIALRTPARLAEAQRRLDECNYAPKNVARLQAYIAGPAKPAKADPTPAPTQKKAPKGKKGNPVKKVCWLAAEAKVGASLSALETAEAKAEFWAAYKAETAAARAAGLL